MHNAQKSTATKFKSSLALSIPVVDKFRHSNSVIGSDHSLHQSRFESFRTDSKAINDIVTSLLPSLSNSFHFDTFDQGTGLSPTAICLSQITYQTQHHRLLVLRSFHSLGRFFQSCVNGKTQCSK